MQYDFVNLDDPASHILNDIKVKKLLLYIYINILIYIKPGIKRIVLI